MLQLGSSVIYFGPESESSSAFWDGSGKDSSPSLCVDTMICVLEAKASKPLSALCSYRPSSSR